MSVCLHQILPVFFMEDRLDPSWRVVIRNDPRSRRRIDEKEYVVFGAGGAGEEADLVDPIPVRRNPANPVPEGDEIDALEVRAVDSRALEVEDDAHLGELQYIDEEEYD